MISLSEHWNAFINTTQDQTLMFTTSKREPATKNSQNQDNQFIQEKMKTHFLLKQETYLHELLFLVSSPITIILVTQLCPFHNL